ncbi:hypothetical protein PAMA_000441 [Pampus argenteus]
MQPEARRSVTMAERSKNVQSAVLQPKKRPSSSSKAQRTKRVEERPQAKSASGPVKKHIDDLFAKEEQYKTPKVSSVEDLTAEDDSVDFFLAKTIRSMEQKNDSVLHENGLDDVSIAGDNVGSDAQIRVLKAKLRIMQEELDQLSCEYYKKDDENTKLSAKIKEIEEDRARLQKTMSIQQTQIEKHRALAEESTKKCDSLQVQVSGLHKEIENLNRSQKQAAAVHSTVEVRLTRAQEEAERLKTQLNKMKQMNKDKIHEEHQSKQNLLAENKVLKKQKAELIVGFKKQLKLIDILKRQKVSFSTLLIV